ncbi:MAG: lipid-A-disaccharide synthase [Planctomycetes bacterium]|nr:lipid-A-disaccharide synthase [Planctomycetota bacterium]
MTRPLRVFISAGEHSGDSHGAALAKRLRQRAPDVVIEGLGGPLMREAGVELRMDFVQHAAMGLLPVLKKLPLFRGVLRETAAHLRAHPPDVLVPIDYPGFNLRLSGRAREAGVPVCYYVSPQVWAWRPGRIHRISRLVDHMMTLFPFEVPLYEAVGVPCTFVGHPLFDELRTRRPSPAFRAGLGLAPDVPLLGLLPGSRRQEVERNLPLELRAAALVAKEDPRVRFAVPVAQPSLRPLVEGLVAEHAPGVPIAVLDGKASDIARVARAAICASGTATLELLHYECPMVIVYQGTWAQELLVRPLLITKWIGLVNILAQKEVCPEFAGARDASPDIARAALGLLGHGRARKRCLTAMKALRRDVDRKGIHGRAAETVLAVARARAAAHPSGCA